MTVVIIGVDNFFFSKSPADRLKIQTTDPDSYRTLVRYLKEQKAQFHIYQLKEDKPIRVVTRKLHPTTRTELIKEKLEVCLFEVTGVTNVLHRTTKLESHLFFVDLEPTSKSSFNSPHYYILKLKFKSHTSQNQSVNYYKEYGHTKTYCCYPSRCVRCGDHHKCSSCPNSRDVPPKCALCSVDHPASYKDFSEYRELQRGKIPLTNSNFLSDNNRNKNTTVRDSHPITNPSINQPSNHVLHLYL